MHILQETFHPEDTSKKWKAEEKLAEYTPQKQREMTGQIVQTVERLGPSGRPWGFTLLRSDYSDDTHWKLFMEKFMELVQQSVKHEEGAGWERIKDDLKIMMLDDKELDGCGLLGNAEYVPPLTSAV